MAGDIFRGIEVFTMTLCALQKLTPIWKYQQLSLVLQGKTINLTEMLLAVIPGLR